MRGPASEDAYRKQRPWVRMKEGRLRERAMSVSGVCVDDRFARRYRRQRNRWCVPRELRMAKWWSGCGSGWIGRGGQ